MASHHLPKVALYGELSFAHHDRGAPKKCYKVSFKKTLSTGHTDHHQWSTLATDHQDRHRTIHQVVSTFKDSRRVNLREKHHREPQQPYQTRPLTTVAAARLACSVSALSAISMPIVDMDSFLDKSLFTKSSQEDIYRKPEVIIRIYY